MPIYPTNRDPLFSELSLADLIKMQVSRCARLRTVTPMTLFLKSRWRILSKSYSTSVIFQLLSSAGRVNGTTHVRSIPSWYLAPPLQVQAYVHQIDFPYTGASGLFKHFLTGATFERRSPSSTLAPTKARYRLRLSNR